MDEEEQTCKLPESSSNGGGGATPKDYLDPPPAPLLNAGEMGKWSLYRAIIAEFTATLLFVYVTVATVIGHKRQSDAAACSGAGVLGIAWAFGGMISVLVYCTAGISGGHINPAVTFALLLARKVSLPRALLYMLAQCLGAMCGAGLVRAVHGSHHYALYGGGANELAPGYSKVAGLVAEAVGTFVLVYTVFSATDPKRMARDSHIPVLAPLLIGFAVLMVHLATIPITGTGINPARSLGPAVVYNGKKAWDDQWIFWVGPLVGAAVAMLYHQYILTAKAFRSNTGTVGTAGISGGHINPAVTFALLLARKVSLPRAALYIVAQCLGAMCGAGLVRAMHGSGQYSLYGGGANELAPGYSKDAGLAAEIVGTFVLVYTVFSATDPKHKARDSHVPVLAPLPIGFAVLMVHLATIPITGTGINPARSLGPAVVYNTKKAWDDQWIFWVGPFIGAAVGMLYHQFVIRAGAAKAFASYRSNYTARPPLN